MLEYVAIALMVALSTIVALIAIGLGTIFGPKKDSAAKSMPYESGMNPYGEGTRRMPVRFYLVAVLFFKVSHRMPHVVATLVAHFRRLKSSLPIPLRTSYANQSHRCCT